ncbi:PEP/pyruvate-binding domain-containing protein [Microlunatus sp. Y2014]|uniref:PEP/pyruvate-binding domain-containing protein n=1 Tax=Microlunatus sp. Y2014 TaxID=3418488 RepID=UPI003DA6DC09
MRWWRERLNSAPVAVRSSATAEDLPDASFAGLQDTVLDVRDEGALLEAVQQCWDSLQSDRVVAYRDQLSSSGRAVDVAMAVVVQQMVDPIAAGVLFTANPVTGRRSQQVVDVVPGLGDVVVDGSVDPQHAELDDGVFPRPIDCLTSEQLLELQRTGRRVERVAGAPQDIEFAFDHEGALWLLQSRAITTLFPVPDERDGSLHAYVEVGHMQGLTRALTPMGQVMLGAAIDGVTGLVGDAFSRLMRFIGGRMYLDLTPMLRNRALRRRVPGILAMYGSTTGVGELLLDDPRLDPVPVPVREVLGKVRSTIRSAAAFVPGLVGGMVTGLAHPERARARALSVQVATPTRSTTPEVLLQEARVVQDQVMEAGMWQMLPALYAGLGSRALADVVLRGIAEPGDVDVTQRGMPHNPTTTMDLALWRVATRARAHRELFTDTPAEDLVTRWRAGDLPDIGLDDFLATYGHRCALEIDVGAPRWAEDPAPIFTALAGHLRLSDPEQAPDVRFERAAQQARTMIITLQERAEASGHPVRGALAGWLLHRSRELTGLRELPKFVWVKAIRQGREQLQAVGDALVERGVLGDRNDIFFLDFAEAERALAGEDQHDRVATRRATHEREVRRTRIPPVLLSDGTLPSSPPVETGARAITGRPAAAGVATGRVRVIRDPRTARIEPGEILVAPSTDPGWTPLFMTAGGLVSETGSPVAHGPTVAREYGIPAVIGIHDATTRFTTGELITIDGALGTVVREDAVVRGGAGPQSRGDS